MSATRRLGIDARPLSNPLTGIGRYTAELVLRMQNNPEWELFLYSDRPFQVAVELAPNVTVKTGNCSGGLISTLFAQLVYPRWAKQDCLDAFWSPRHHLPLLMSKELPKLVTIHDLVWKRMPETMSNGGLWVERLLMPASLRRAERIITVSHATARDLEEYFPDIRAKVQCIHSGHPGMPPTAAAAPTEPPYILFVGTMEPRKNLGTLLAAWQLLQERQPSEAQLKIVGGVGWKQQDPRITADKLGIASTVEVVGRVEDAELQHLYEGAYAFAMPSLYEGFGLPLLEAMRFGIPIIAGNHSAIPEVVGDGGLLIDVTSAAALAAAMSDILSKPELRHTLAGKARQRASTFSWENAANVTTQAVADAASQR